YLDADITAAHQLGACEENYHHQRQHDGREHANGEKNFIIHLLTPSLQLYARERHEAQRHQSDCNEGDAQTLKSVGNIAVLELLADSSQQCDRQGPGGTRTEAIDHAFGRVVVPFDHEQRATHDGAVHRDQRQEHAQGVVERRHELVQQHLEDLHDRGNNADVAQQPEEAEVDVRQAGPGQRAVLEQVGEDQVVGRYGNGLHHDDRDTQADSRLHLLGDGDEGTHAEEERQGHVLDEHGFDEQTDVVLH